MNRNNAVVIGLLGAIVGLLVVLTFQLQTVPSAQGQTSSGVSSKWLMGTATTSGGQAACFLFNTEDMKLAMYQATGRVFNYCGVRLCTYDFQLVQYPRNMRPSVEDIKKQAKKSR